MTSTGLNLSGTEEAQGLGQGFPRATDDVNVSPQLQVTVRTVLGSLTGQILRISASNDMTVQDFKLLARWRDPVPPNERSNTAETIEGVSPDFHHLFFKGTKLKNGLCSLGDAGVEKGSELSFGVEESGLAGQLRGGTMEHLRNPPVHLSGVGDDKILMMVLHEYKIRAQRHDTQLSGDQLDDLYDIFTTTGFDFG